MGLVFSPTTKVVRPNHHTTKTIPLPRSTILFILPKTLCYPLLIVLPCLDVAVDTRVTVTGGGCGQVTGWTTIGKSFTRQRQTCRSKGTNRTYSRGQSVLTNGYSFSPSSTPQLCKWDGDGCLALVPAHNWHFGLRNSSILNLIHTL